jgi:hypothetical protein
VFVTVNIEGKDANQISSFFGVTADDTPAVVGFDTKGNRKYAFEGTIRWEV